MPNFNGLDPVTTAYLKTANAICDTLFGPIDAKVGRDRDQSDLRDEAEQTTETCCFPKCTNLATSECSCGAMLCEKHEFACPNNSL